MTSLEEEARRLSPEERERILEEMRTTLEQAGYDPDDPQPRLGSVTVSGVSVGSGTAVISSPLRRFRISWLFAVALASALLLIVGATLLFGGGGREVFSAVLGGVAGSLVPLAVMGWKRTQPVR
ncbi:hypothetical protein GIS00_20900 [Nakamurella sp. YIM 132087]|uniref:Uncharacterized protein n=1 Tax=Nakamurella alba TaxID=2665158 RepID=A0A7K1FSM5_9ACTN|nr:hypothetical protein [Nakamurella alba]MTD16399.1 hypothetical protein [Nakamurella alba]